jgi:hypothetical protein
MTNIMGTACQFKCVTEVGSTQSINDTGHEPSLQRGHHMISTVTNNRCEWKSASTISLFLGKSLNLSPLITWNNQTL